MSEGIRRVHGTAEVVGIAKDSAWPVGPTPGSLNRKSSRSRDSDSSEESDSNSSIESTSPASSLSSPLSGGRNKSVQALQGINEITVDQSQLTVRVLSRLRDLWELSNGHVCLSDHYTPPEPEVEQSMEIDDFAEGLGIKLEEIDLKEEGEESVDIVKKVMGETGVKRANIVKEIIETEETYIRGLQELVEVIFLSSRPTNNRFTLTTSSPHYQRPTNSESSFVTSKQSSTSTKTSSSPPSSKQPNNPPPPPPLTSTPSP